MKKKVLSEIKEVLRYISIGDFSKKVNLDEEVDQDTLEFKMAVNLMSENIEEILNADRIKTELISKSEKKLRKSYILLKKAKASIKQEKAKLEALLTNIGEGVVAINNEGRIIFINKQAEKFFEKKGDKIIGKKLENNIDCYINKDSMCGKLDSMLILDKNKTKPTRFEAFCAMSDKSVVPFLITTSPITFKGKITGNVLTFMDVTREKAIERAKSDFLSIASHQLRTPLGGAKWLVELMLAKSDLKADNKKSLKDIYGLIERTVNIVNDLLNAARLQADGIRAKQMVFDLCDCIKEVVKECRKENLVTESIRISYPKNPVKIIADKELIKNIFHNIIENSCQYTPEKKKIILDVKKKREKIEVTVKDNGIGISKEDQKHLFTKFFRAQDAVGMNTTGSGLGLYLAKNILDSIGGSIKINSEPKKGTECTVALPKKT